MEPTAAEPGMEGASVALHGQHPSGEAPRGDQEAAGHTCLLNQRVAAAPDQ